MEAISLAKGTANLTAAPAVNDSWLSRPLQVTGPTARLNIPSYTPGQQFNSTLHPNTIGYSGLSRGHENRQSYLALMYCICYDGTYPTRP